MRLSFQISEFTGLNMTLKDVNIRFEGSLEDLQGTVALMKELEEQQVPSVGQAEVPEVSALLNSMIHNALQPEHPWEKEEETQPEVKSPKQIWGHKREAFDAKKESPEKEEEKQVAVEVKEQEVESKEEAPQAKPTLDFLKGLGQKATQNSSTTDFKALFAGMVEKKDHLQK
ncbi:MAG: hypothetical protein ACRC5C_13165 [Bacilli bacterium]